MRLLLDECIDEGLRHHFTGHECQTCRYAGLTGLANGALLAAAADQAGFEVVITVDQNMPNQQSLLGRSISLLAIRARTTNLDDLLVLLPDVMKALEILRPGEVVRIGIR
jgi:predicted nuclease of predicted toxin-antitoxin system